MALMVTSLCWRPTWWHTCLGVYYWFEKGWRDWLKWGFPQLGMKISARIPVQNQCAIVLDDFRIVRWFCSNGKEWSKIIQYFFKSIILIIFFDSVRLNNSLNMWKEIFYKEELFFLHYRTSLDHSYKKHKSEKIYFFKSFHVKHNCKTNF